MTDEPKFTSRRELRDAERAGLVESEALGFDGTPRVREVSVPAESTGQPLTRRQLRELEKTGGVLTVHTSQIQLPELPDEAEAPAAAEPQEPAADTISQPYVAPDVIGAEREEPVTVANQIVAVSAVVSEPEPALLSESVLQPESPAVRQPSAELAAKALADAAEFEAVLAGALQAPAAKSNKTRRGLVITAVVLLVVVGGLAAAASFLHILK